MKKRRLSSKSRDITDETYAEAYRAVDRAKDRERHIDLIELLGRALDKLSLPRFKGAKLRAPLAESGVLDHAGAQLGGPVELGQQQFAKGLLRHRATFYRGARKKTP